MSQLLWDNTDPPEDRPAGSDAAAAPLQAGAAGEQPHGTAGDQKEPAVPPAQAISQANTADIAAQQETPIIPAKTDAPRVQEPLAVPLSHARAEPEDHAAAATVGQSPALPANPLPVTAISPIPQAQEPPDPRQWRFPRWPIRNLKLSTAVEGAHRVLIVGRIMVGIVTVGLLMLLGRVWQLETGPDAKIAALINTQKSQIKLQGRRGNIEDREGRLIATSHSVMQLFVDPRLIQDPSTFAEHVGLALGYDPAWLDQRIGAHAEGRYVLLDRRLDEKRANTFKDLSLRGLGAQPRLVRDYPEGSLAGQLIGFANIDGHGIEGVERLFDHELAGQPGHLTYFRDARRRALWVDADQYVPPIDGKSVRLSIDLTIESFAENALSEACREFGAPSGELIVMDPATGEVLAMANYPSLDPNDFGTTKPDKRRNRAITDTFEPGSIFKPVVWSFATQEHFASPDEWIDTGDSGVYVTANGRHLHDAHPSGRITWDQVLIHSSNIGMAIVAQRMGAQNLYDAVRAFGLGSPTHIGLPGEITGRVRPLKSWTSFSVTSVPMGQEVSVTPLQMARAFCTFANGGYLVQPTIRMCDPRDPQSQPVFHRILTPEIADHTREVLRRVVVDEGGTGHRANSPMYDIFGKTGTAQIADGHRGGYIPGAFTASFICGAIYDNPRIIVACIIHHPTHSDHYGGTVAAPAARKVVEQTLLYMGIAPNPVPDTQDSANSPIMANAVNGHD